jgi:hypothetical protein
MQLSPETFAYVFRLFQYFCEFVSIAVMVGLLLDPTLGLIAATSCTLVRAIMQTPLKDEQQRAKWLYWLLWTLLDFLVLLSCCVWEFSILEKGPIGIETFKAIVGASVVILVGIVALRFIFAVMRQFLRFFGQL